ncbi:CHAT domain-containing protein [Plectonema cf. radiosum LEGE 06105]|uniref:CHAT domain-containing protein n=1 Tax=Plectonema cf. radiosum LEGE 06105 TaxID=945769 RepID=A0A8J7EYS6_9CYAN|nr:CHAT domain-containing tetratricopeptide repeat protein [Plectonema radiosum]MBE9211472.1 CHAT domain-containing protein [Plectonema cf. radiosum LEGE 06105]
MEPHPQPLSLVRRGENEAESLSQQALEEYQANQLPQAIKLWQQALKIYLELDDKSAIITTLKNLIAVNQQLKNYPQAIIYLEQYLTLTREIEDKSGEISALTTLAKIHAQQGKFTKTVDYYQQALILVRETSNKSEEAVILGNLAIAYKTLGNYPKAIETNQQSLEILQQMGNRQDRAIVLKNLGNVYEALGDYDNAITSYEKSLQIARENNNQTVEATTLSNLGQIYANQGEYQKAIAIFQDSLKISSAINDISGQASTLINLGSTYHFLGQRDKAIENYQQSLKLAQDIGDKQRELEALGSLGLAYEDLKDYPQAIIYLKDSLAIAKEIGDPEAQAMGLNNLGHVLFTAGKLEEAEKTLRDALKLLDGMRPGLSDSYQVSIFDTQVHYYNLLQQILIAANKPEAALEATERGRARAFVELLAGRFSEDKQSINTKFPSVKKIREIAREQNATLVEYSIVPDDDFKFLGKQRGRGAELFIWVVKPTGEIGFRKVDLKPLWKHNLTLDDLVNSSRCLVKGIICQQQAENILKLGAEKNSEYIALRKLHKFLIEPIADLLPKDATERVIFIPQESLFLTPFAALQDSDGKYLIEKHTILTAPAIQVLDLTRQQKKRLEKQNLANLKPLIVGNPIMPKVSINGEEAQQLAVLPESEIEAIEIAKMFQQEPMIGAKATKANVKNQLSKATLIHLATHGLLQYRSSDSSSSLQGLGIPGAIALAPSGKDDGLLTATEIFDLRLVASLVVLSACDTGIGRITGDGVIGLSRAFISAGTPSVLVSLWTVPDEKTRLLMIAFYQELQQNPDKAIALRTAMLQLMEFGFEPLDWAGFTLVGEAK